MTFRGAAVGTNLIDGHTYRLCVPGTAHRHEYSTFYTPIFRYGVPYMYPTKQKGASDYH